MQTESKSKTAVLALLVALLALPAVAQEIQTPFLDLPRVSPGATVTQRVGVAEIGISYHRPAVNDREVWGALVPYDQVWRTGANENTVITFSHDVTVEGEPLVAGSYGFHAIPGEESWQLIFSHDDTLWGSYSYDEANDALRVTVTPTEAPAFQERMLFTFDEVGADSTTVALTWADLRVPFTVGVDVHAQTLASIEEQLKGVGQFFWMPWNQAAQYCLQEELDCADAMAWIDRSIQSEERFENLSIKARLLRKAGEEEQADEVMAKALEMGNAGQLHNYARQLIGQGEKEKALEVFQRNVRQNPDAWFVELGLARGYSALGRFDEAAEQMKIAVGRAPENQKAYVQGLVEQLEKGEDVN